MTNASSVPLTSGPPETVLPPAPDDDVAALEAALAGPVGQRKSALGRVVAGNPTFLDGWARLAETADQPVESYAYARVGYHRGLDALRGAGWKGSGYVRWVHPTNRGFLRALEQLRAAAEAIGEEPEAMRCLMFLRQLDPTWDASAGEGDS